jgi:RNA polymerase sigma-70 factor (ECF subfamily)
MPEGEDSRRDDQLLRAFRRGDATALGTLIGRHQRALHGYLQAMCGSRTEADDLFQETWRRVIRNPRSFRGGAFNAWLWRIARNLLVDRLRRRRPSVSLDDVTEAGTAFADLTPSTEPGPAALLEAAEIGQAVAAAVRRLSPDQRDVFLLRTQADLTFAEIAKLRRVPLNTALGRMHYAMQRLRRELGGLYAALTGAAADAEQAGRETKP